ncbi:MAG: hypothetical protein ACKON7_10935 [Planctomycetaceae bacterium]
MTPSYEPRAWKAVRVLAFVGVVALLWRAVASAPPRPAGEADVRSGPAR